MEILPRSNYYTKNYSFTSLHEQFIHKFGKFQTNIHGSFANDSKIEWYQSSLAKLGILVEKNRPIRNSRRKKKRRIFSERVRLDPLLAPFIRHFRCDIKPIANVCVTWRVRRRDSSRRNLSIVRGIISAATAELWNYQPRGWLREQPLSSRADFARSWVKKRKGEKWIIGKFVPAKEKKKKKKDNRKNTRLNRK